MRVVDLARRAGDAARIVDEPRRVALPHALNELARRVLESPIGVVENPSHDAGVVAPPVDHREKLLRKLLLVDVRGGSAPYPPGAQKAAGHVLKDVEPVLVAVPVPGVRLDL